MSEFFWFELHFPRPLVPETATELLRRLASESSRAPYVFEAIGSDGQVRYRLGVPQRAVPTARRFFAALVPGAVLDETTAGEVTASAAIRMTTANASLGLRTSRPIESSRSLLAALAAAGPNETVVLQLFLGDSRPARVVGRRVVDPNQGMLDQLISGRREVDAAVAGRLREKATEHTIQTMVRISVDAPDVTKRHALLKGVVGALRLSQSAGTTIGFSRAAPSYMTRTPHRNLVLLSPAEILCLSAWPLGESELPGLSSLHPRPVRLSGAATDQERVFAITTSPGDERRVGLSIADNLMHLQVLGPNGVGKSTLLTNLIAADMKAGRSVVVLDPKQDLAHEGVLARVPYARRNDVVVIDPLQEQPVGISPLSQGTRAPELVADSIVNTVAELFPNDIGGRTKDVLSAAVMSIVEIPGATITWLPRLLDGGDDDFRTWVISQVTDPVLQAFWSEFNSLTHAQQTQYVGPVLSRLRRLILSPTLRRMLDQPEPRFNLAEVFTKPRIVVVPLNSGLIGLDNMRVIGSLLVAQLWGLTLARAAVPSRERTPVSIYIDEAAEFVRTSGAELADFLARARGLGVALTIAAQGRTQFAEEVAEAIDLNARSRVIFQTSSRDAKFFGSQAPGLEAEDFLALPKYNVYANLIRDGQLTGWFSARTLPAPPEISDPASLVARSARTFGRDPAAPARQDPKPSHEPSIGRRRRSE